MRFFIAWSIQTQVAILIVAIQLLSHALSVLLFFQFVYSEDNPPPVALTAGILEPIASIASLTRQAEEEALKTHILRLIAESDKRFTLVAANQREAFERLAAPEGLHERVRLAAFPQIESEDILAFNTRGSTGLPFHNEDFSVLLWLSEDLGLKFDPSKNSISRALPILPVIYGLIALGTSLLLIALWASKTLISPLNRLAEEASKLPSHMGKKEIDETGPAEIRIVARSFNKMRDRVQKAMKERTLALAAISHDLRTPLTRLRLKIETGKASKDPEGALEDIDGLEELLDFALEYLRYNSQSINPQVLDLKSSIEDLVAFYPGTEFQLNLEENGDFKADVNKSMIFRMIENIVENSLKYAPGSPVEIYVTTNLNSIELKISDNGPGVDASRIKELINPFTTGDEARKPTDKPSLGLGLSIAADIAQRHGGNLALRNRQRGGLEVSITLPKSTRSA